MEIEKIKNRLKELDQERQDLLSQLQKLQGYNKVPSSKPRHGLSKLIYDTIECTGAEGINIADLFEELDLLQPNAKQNTIRVTLSKMKKNELINVRGTKGSYVYYV